MDINEKDKMERYFRNAVPFIWGVIPGNKKTVYIVLRTTLRELGEDKLIPENQNPTYVMVTEALLSGLGIERLISEIVVKEVQRQFRQRPGALEFLRAHWISGGLPRWQTLQGLRAPRTIKQKLLDAVDSKDAPELSQQTSDILDAFLEVNHQFKYIHGWTVFAGLWFEEIEPMLKDSVKGNSDHSPSQ